jgi:hypothetical protein
MGKIITAIITLIVASACGCTDRYSIYKEFKICDSEYFNGTEFAAKSALTSFLNNAEKNLDSIIKEPESVPAMERMNYPYVMALSWLRLAGIYRFEQNKGNYNKAMARAIHYFDTMKVPNFTTDVRYQKNKEVRLLEFLAQLEAAYPPKWRTSSVKTGMPKP